MNEPYPDVGGSAGELARQRLRLVALAFLAAALLPHVYLLALRVVPVPITLNMLAPHRSPRLPPEAPLSRYHEHPEGIKARSGGLGPTRARLPGAE